MDKSFYGQDSEGRVLLRAPDLTAAENDWMNVWAKTFATLGFPESNDPFSGTVKGAVISPETIDPATGQRCSSANAFLNPVRHRSNLTVITGATVEKILFAEGGPSEGDAVAQGVAYTVVKDGKPGKFEVKAHKEVILAAGALSSPRLLEVSGVGDAALLKELGIPVIVDNPYVGENLQNHVLVGHSFEVRDDSDMPSRDPLNRQEPAVLQAAMAAYAKG